MIRAAKWPLDILPAKLIKIIKKRKDIKNISSKMTFYYNIINHYLHSN